MAPLTPRERLLTALRHQEPDRIPLDLGSFVSTIEAIPFEDLKRYLGKKWKTQCFLRDHVEVPEELLIQWGIDTRYVRLKPPKKWKKVIEPDNSFVDEWGTRWKKPPGSPYWDPVGHPLKRATIEDLEKYPWPDPDDPGRTEGLREEAKRLRESTNYAIVADGPFLGIFEASWVCLCGPEKFFTDLVLDKPFVRALFDKIIDIQIRIMKHYLEAVGDLIDVIIVGDDLGGENGPLISPAMYRELVKPYHQRLWSFIKKNTPADLFLHCCGSITPFIPDLIELGVDIINPVQVAAKDMDPKMLKAKFGDRLTFWGGIDTQRVMPYGTPDEVEEEVKRRIADLAPGGGFVLTSVHNIQPGVPPQNIVRMYEAALKYGRYPIRI
jgi:uroporphyrinogen decarboxylase